MKRGIKMNTALTSEPGDARGMENHFANRVGWLRAAVLGANDGIVSTASLIIGVAAAGTDRNEIILAGLAGLVAGAMSMAAGEYVSVSSQADSEAADLAREKLELETDPEFEHNELAEIFIGRGLDDDLAGKVATQLMAKDALGAHAREELGISEITQARPVQAGLTSAATFSAGAALPMLPAVFAPLDQIITITTITTITALGLLGAVSARTGGSPMFKAVARVTVWGALAMAATALVGHLFGISVG